jgi:hypothetical protein
MSNDDDQTCVFSDVIQGAWIHASAPNIRDEILVLPSKILPGLLGSEPLMCMSTSHQVTNRYPLMSVSSNGCFPHFTCIEFIMENPGFITYQLGWKGYWPQDIIGVTDPYDVFCSEESFQGRFDTLTSQYMEPTVHSMVHDPRGSDFQNRTSACFIGNTNSTVVSFERLPGQSGERCRGNFFVSCDDPTAIRINHSSCSHWPVKSTTYHCMSSVLLDDGRRLVVTVADHSIRVAANDIDLRCWMFSEGLNNLYVLPWADCGEDTFDSIVNADKYRELRDTFVIDVNEQYSRTCNEEPTTTESSPIVITVIVEVETTTYTFPNFVGKGAHTQMNIAVLVVMVVAAIYW